MTDYTKLVEALRLCQVGECGCGKCYYKELKGYWCDDKLKLDAAAAIEALQAENPIVETVLVDKMRQQMEETVCHCNVKENAELIAKILDDDVDRKVFEMPKRGEWINSKERMRPDMCSICGCVYEADRFMDKIAWNYCPNCGAKMEVRGCLNGLSLVTMMGT